MSDTSQNSLRDGALVILASVALTVSLIYTKAILVPFVFALFIQTILKSGICITQSKFKAPRNVATWLAVIGFLMILLVVFFFASISIQKFFLSAGKYKEKIAIFIEQLNDFISAFGPELDKTSILELVKKLPLFSFANNIGEIIIGLFGNIVLVVIIVLFMMTGSSKEVSHPLVETIQNKISRYMMTKFLTSFLTASIVGVTLVAFRIDLAFMFAVLTFLLNFLPNIGSIIAMILPIPVVLVQCGFGWQFGVIMFITVSSQFVIGNILEPKFMGRTMDLHPVVVLMFLIFWGSVWGIAGMFLSVPITAILKIILEQIPQTQRIASLLAGRFGNPRANELF